MKLKIEIAVIAMIGMSIGVSAQKEISLEGANDPNFVNKNGNVGIGTKSPSAKLDVKGHAIFNTASNHTEVQFGSDRNDRIISDNSPNKYYGGGMFFRVTPDASLGIPHNYIDVMMLTDKGNIGIGTKSPSAKLDVKGHAIFNTASNHTEVQFGSDRNDRIISDNSPNKYYGGGMFFRVTPDASLGIPHNYIDVMMLTDKGKVGIGTKTMGNHRLAVEGSIGAREIKVEASGWSDFVFENDYNLPTLLDVENHIKEKGHLKDIPSEEEVEKNGIFLGEMDAKLLQKIEELTLYTIAQEKKLNVQQKEIKELKRQNSEIKELKALVQQLLKDKY